MLNRERTHTHDCNTLEREDGIFASRLDWNLVRETGEGGDGGGG